MTGEIVVVGPRLDLEIVYHSVPGRPLDGPHVKQPPKVVIEYSGRTPTAITVCHCYRMPLILVNWEDISDYGRYNYVISVQGVNIERCSAAL